MEVLIPYSEVFLAAVTHATLQLGIGTLLLLYHASLGRHVRKKTRFLADGYIAGVGLMVFLELAALAFILDRYFEKALYPEELIIVVGMLVALAIASWAFYYRRGKSTELWLPRSIAKYINHRAKETNNNIEAFSLGLLTTLAEMPFTIVLILVAANALLKLELLQQIIGLVIYSVIAVIPLIWLRLTIRRGQTVVTVQRWRVKHKMFFRLLTGVGFLVLGLYLFSFEVLV